MRILITRHAEDLGPSFDEENRVLTKKGVLQSKKLGEIVRKFNPSYIYSSPLKRAKQTAEIIRKYCNIQIRILDGLREQITKNEKSKDNKLITNKGYIELNQKYFNGESYGELYTRTKKIWDLIKEKHNYKDKIVIITHGRLMTFLISEILGFIPDGFYFANENTSYVVLLINPDWRPMILLPIAGQLYI